VGSTPVGAAVGLVAFIGIEAGSLIGTGSLVPGARLVNGILWMAGPSNTLLALAAAGIASAGSRTRELTQEEYDWANTEVFDSALPARSQLVLTDTIGGGDRPFTFPRFDGKITLNMGSEGYDNPRNYGLARGKKNGEVLIHELTHSWQIAHSSMQVEFLADALASKLYEVMGDAYAYGASDKPYGDFNIEEQAEIVSDWFAGRNNHGVGTTMIPKDESSPYFKYIRDNVQAGHY